MMNLSVNSNADPAIETINGTINMLGFTSRKEVGRDEFDSKIYGSCEDENLRSGIVEGTGNLNLHYPYNDIQYHNMNQWMMHCSHIYFRIKHNIIPNMFYSKHTIPHYINIRRSSGLIQKARLKHNCGLRMSGSTTNEDSSAKLYVRLEFNEPRSMTPLSATYLDVFKDVTLDAIIELNPEFKEFSMTFSLPNYEIHPVDSHKYNVMKYYCDIHTEWCERVLNPMISRFNRKYSINIRVHDIYI